jgi:hypothetical protein
MPTDRDKVEEISDDGEPLWDKESRQNGKKLTELILWLSNYKLSGILE